MGEPKMEMWCRWEKGAKGRGWGVQRARSEPGWLDVWMAGLYVG